MCNIFCIPHLHNFQLQRVVLYIINSGLCIFYIFTTPVASAFASDHFHSAETIPADNVLIFFFMQTVTLKKNTLGQSLHTKWMNLMQVYIASVLF